MYNIFRLLKFRDVSAWEKCSCILFYFTERERQTDRQTDRQRHRDRERETEKENDKTV